MNLDMTGTGMFFRQPHYRRYLNNDSKIVAVQVQDFDYRDYDASRFVDLTMFETRGEAENTPIGIGDVLAQVAEASEGSPAHGQAARLLLAIESHRGLVGGAL